MTIVISTTTVDGNTMNAASGEDFILLDGTILSSVMGSAIRANGSDSNLLIMGKVFGKTYGVEMGTNADTDARNTLTVTADGIVSGYNAGVRTVGKFAVIDNAGTIRGTGDTGILLTNNEYLNAVTIRNSGTIMGQNTAIFVNGGAMRLVNDGLVTGGSLGVAIQGGVAVDTIVNRGLIDGDIDTYGSDDAITNRGTITGALDLGMGNDRVDNRAGEITGDIDLGGGDDVLVVGARPETANGGNGRDRLDFHYATSGLVLALDDSVTVAGWAVGDDFAGFEDVTGTNLRDTIVGDGEANTFAGLRGSDTLNGSGGNDYLDGGSGSDTLDGGTGFDTLEGGNGNDVLIGAAGTDTARGGAGADQFRFDDGDFGGTNDMVADSILDFVHAEGDRIHLSAVDANTTTPATDDAFTYIGSKAFTGVAGQLRIETGMGKMYVMGDTNGDAVADFWIVLTGTMTLYKADFVL